MLDDNVITIGRRISLEELDSMSREKMMEKAHRMVSEMCREAEEKEMEAFIA